MEKKDYSFIHHFFRQISRDFTTYSNIAYPSALKKNMSSVEPSSSLSEKSDLYICDDPVSVQDYHDNIFSSPYFLFVGNPENFSRFNTEDFVLVNIIKKGGGQHANPLVFIEDASTHKRLGKIGISNLYYATSKTQLRRNMDDNIEQVKELNKAMEKLKLEIESKQTLISYHESLLTGDGSKKSDDKKSLEKERQSVTNKATAGLEKINDDEWDEAEDVEINEENGFCPIQ
jgi:hypothetical protein